MDPQRARPPGHLAFGSEGGVLGAAGHIHVVTCHRCRTRDEDFECSCPEPCDWKDCPKPGQRAGPLDYYRPEVPRFK